MLVEPSLRNSVQPPSWVYGSEPKVGRGSLGWGSGQRGGRIGDGCGGTPAAVLPASLVLTELHAVDIAPGSMLEVQRRSGPQFPHSFFKVMEKKCSRPIQVCVWLQPCVVIYRGEALLPQHFGWSV